MKRTALIILVFEISFLGGTGMAWANSPASNISNSSNFIPRERAAFDDTLSLPSPHSLEQQARQRYETGKFTEAIALLQRAIAHYITQGDRTGAAIAMRNLALVYQQLGRWEQAEKMIAAVFQILPDIDDTEERKRLSAQALDVRGQLQLSRAQRERALETWEQASDIYRQMGDVSGFTRAQIYQAQALQALGLYARAVKTLTQIQQQLNQEPDTLLKGRVLLSLGDILRRVGRYPESQLALEQSLKIAQSFHAAPAIADSLLGLGNTAKLQQRTEIALDYYQRAINTSSLPDSQVQGQLNQFNLFIAAKEWSRAIALIPQIEQRLIALSPGQIAIGGWISLSRGLIEMEKAAADIKAPSVARYLATAIQLARNLGDNRAEAHAIGNLGMLYEHHSRLHEAQALTEKALLITQGINATELTYQWQWQLGRILKARGERQKAIVTYTQAVKTLQSLRGDLVAISAEIQFSFRESVEPIYRELADLILQPGATQDDLKRARDAIESLQLAELDNFFRDTCLDAQPIQIDRLDANAAVVYTIILPDRLEAIAALPGQPLRHYTTPLSQETVEQTLFLTSSIIQSYWRSPNLQPLQQLYDWIVRPIAADLAAKRIKTLVFVADGVLRNIPPAVFHDGQQYLIEKYGVAIAPSLQLIDPQPLAQQKRELLLAGLTEARQGFTALPGVKSEVESIGAQFPASILLNDAFTESNFNKVVTAAPYQVVHLATHGQFSSEAEDTFILTWDGRISIDELNSLLRQDPKKIRPIELLVLSACQTAVGDRRAALGLAGIAVRAGARSTLATLWSVGDLSTTVLMSHFYQELANNNISKAEALRHAQLNVLRHQDFSHPYYWSAFILIGNWL
jgi:CHAT domain-containing protein